jgi:hypothetical protein
MSVEEKVLALKAFLHSLEAVESKVGACGTYLLRILYRWPWTHLICYDVRLGAEYSGGARGNSGAILRSCLSMLLPIPSRVMLMSAPPPQTRSWIAS